MSDHPEPLHHQLRLEKGQDPEDHHQARKELPWTFTLYALLFLGGYWWFMASVSGIKATVRLIYPMIPVFLGVGILNRRFPELARVLVMVFGVLSFLESELMMEGFWVI